MNARAVAFTGPSNSGKTTAIVNVANVLKERFKLAIVKHDPSDKGVFDKEGKDSWKFSQTGAEVVVTSPTRTTYFSKQPRDIEGIIAMLGTFEILIVEGLKTLPLPRIAVFRNALDPSYFPMSDALAIDGSVDVEAYDIPAHLDILDLNDPHAISEWILANAQTVRRKDD